MAVPTLPYDSMPGMDLWEKLELTSSDPCRTAIVNVKNRQKDVYRAKTTESGSNPLTTFTNECGETIATLEWCLYLSDKLSVRGGKKMNVGKWLEIKKVHKERCASFVDEHGNMYTWRSAGNNGSLQLFEGKDPSDPIAKFFPPTPRTEDGQEQKPATVILSDRAKEGRDEILLSALLLERARKLSKGNSSSPFDYSGVSLLNLSIVTA